MDKSLRENKIYNFLSINLNKSKRDKKNLWKTKMRRRKNHEKRLFLLCFNLFFFILLKFLSLTF